MTFPVGVGVDGETLVSDFSDSNTCHVLVAGTSGSGKSEWLKTLVASLALGHPAEHIRFALVDPKILTFGGIKDSPYLWKPIARISSPLSQVWTLLQRKWTVDITFWHGTVTSAFLSAFRRE